VVGKDDRTQQPLIRPHPSTGLQLGPITGANSFGTVTRLCQAVVSALALPKSPWIQWLLVAIDSGIVVIGISSSIAATDFPRLSRADYSVNEWSRDGYCNPCTVIEFMLNEQYGVIVLPYKVQPHGDLA
jgi:hypothetical protein